MSDGSTVTGILKEGRILTLDQEFPLRSAKLTLTVASVEPLTADAPVGDICRNDHAVPYMEAITAIRENLRAHGHLPLTKEEIDAYLEEERNS